MRRSHLLFALLLAGCAQLLGIREGSGPDDNDGGAGSANVAGNGGDGGLSGSGGIGGDGGDIGGGGADPCLGVQPYENIVIDDLPLAYWRFSDPAVNGQHVDEMGMYHAVEMQRIIDIDDVGLVRCDEGGAANFAGLSVQALAIAMSDPLMSPLQFAAKAPFTLEVWIEARLDAGGVFDKLDNGNSDDGYHFGFNNLGFFLSRSTAAGPVAELRIGGVVVNDIHHLVGTFDGSDMHIYRDGQHIDSLTADFNLTPAPVELTIGSGLFDGVIDEVAIYDYALDLSQVQAHYDAGRRP